jgi:hypothetical protein
MTTDNQIERRLEQWLEEAAAPRLPEYFDEMLARTERTRQRQAWRFPSGWLFRRDLGASTPLPQPVWVLIVVALLALAGLVVAVGALQRQYLEPRPYFIKGGALPAILLPGDDTIWAAGSMEILKIDPRTNVATTIVRDLPAGHHSTVGIGDSIWTVHDELGTVSEYDAATGRELTKIELNDGLAEPIVAFGSLWVPNYARGTVVRIDAKSRAVVATFEVGPSLTTMAPGGGMVWLVNPNARPAVRGIDPATNRVVRTIPDCADGVGYAFDRLWLRNCDEPAISVRDPATGELLGTVPIDVLATSVEARGRVWWPLRDSAPGTTTLVGVDPRTLTVTAEYIAPVEAESLTAGFDSFWIGAPTGTEVVRIPFAALPPP